jgi:hypothetical protein
VSLEAAESCLQRQNNYDQPGCAPAKGRENGFQKSQNERIKGFSAACEVGP